ncbi:MAG: hypothetical protein M5T52_16185 [Ignavibacteriaceae bacterium]|nr:hypothetical protein [Ignavibacteriaceae bacterium]
MWLNQDAYLALSDLEKSKSLNYKIHTKGNGVYLFLIDGNISVGDDKLFKRDGIGLWETEEISINASEDSRLLFIEVPMM